MKKLLAALVTGWLFLAVPVHADAAEAVAIGTTWDPASGDVTTWLLTEDGRTWTTTEYDDILPGDLVDVTYDADGLPVFGYYTGWLSYEGGRLYAHRNSPAPGVWDAVPWTW